MQIAEIAMTKKQDLAGGKRKASCAFGREYNLRCLLLRALGCKRRRECNSVCDGY